MQCSLHPDVVAVDTCVRCGAFVCGDCLELLGEEPFCRSCYGRRDVSGGGSTRAILALVLSSTGLPASLLMCGAPFGIVGLILAHLEGRAIESGDAPRGSRPFVKVAKVLGWISIVLTVLAVGASILLGVLLASQLPAQTP